MKPFVSIERILNSGAFALAFLASSWVQGQTNTLSPYSLYGIGDPVYSTLSGQSSLSHTSIAMLNTLNINHTNPAAISYINRPSFNVDFRNEFLSLNAGGASQTSSVFSVDNISLAFPIVNNSARRRKSGVAFGLTPYSRQGYEVVVFEDVEDLGTTEYRFVGEGGINRAFLEGSFDIIADSGRVNVLSLGVQGAYVFGSNSRNRITRVDSNGTISGSNVYRKETTEVSAADMRIGLLYAHKLKFNSGTSKERSGILSLGAYYTPSVNFNATSSSVTYTFVNPPNNASVIDTVQISSGKSPITSPTQIGFGVAFNYNDRINTGIDLHYGQWSSLAYDGVNQNLNDVLRASWGIEYVPDPTAFQEFFKTVRYRGGLSFEQTHINLNGNQATRFGASAGFGIPVVASRSTSIFNLGIEYASRGGGNLPLQENYFNLNIGFTFTPNQYDRWFVKRKYD